MIGRYLHHAGLILIAAVVPTAILYAIAISLELCGYSGHCDAASMAVIICLPPMILTFAVVFRVPRSSQYWLPIALSGRVWSDRGDHDGQSRFVRIDWYESPQSSGNITLACNGLLHISGLGDDLTLAL